MSYYELGRRWANRLSLNDEKLLIKTLGFDPRGEKIQRVLLWIEEELGPKHDFLLKIRRKAELVGDFGNEVRDDRQPLPPARRSFVKITR